jgi:hypothetical protein
MASTSRNNALNEVFAASGDWRLVVLEQVENFVSEHHGSAVPRVEISKSP